MQYKQVEDIIEAIDTHLLDLRQNGGKLPFPIVLDWSGEQNNEERILRLSAAGKCPRQMAYNVHFPEEREQLTARALNVFIHGDLLHEKERNLIRQVADLQDVEAQVTFEIEPGGVQVRGHIDGVFTINNEKILLDIKSMNTRSFKEAVELNAVRSDYVAQLNAYMEATGIRKAALWLYNKDTSHRAVIMLERDQDVIDGIRERFKAVLTSAPDNLPDRMYSPVKEVSKGKFTGREYLPWQCGYCPFTERCWSEEGFSMEFDKGKPRWFRESDEVEE